jgi:thiamine-phosphate pyrophosphorylase
LLPARKPILCYVTDRRGLEAAPISSHAQSGFSAAAGTRSLRDSIRLAAAAGATWIQIREKDLEGGALTELARFAVSVTSGTSTSIFVNDRLDVALVAGAAGIHLGEKSLPLEVVTDWRRASGRTDFLIGVSCHSLESARAAGTGGANYIFFGPVFTTPSKAEFGAPQGIERLREVCASVRIPVLAIGGVNAETARACIEAGAAGIAAIRLFQDAENVTDIVGRLRACGARL